MLPISVGLEVYNIIKEWVTKCNAHVAIDVNNVKNEISIYTDKPGQMIGPQGKLVDEYQKRLNSLPHYQKHKFLIYEITMVITPESPEITQEEYDKELNEYWKCRFAMWDDEQQEDNEVEYHCTWDDIW